MSASQNTISQNDVRAFIHLRVCSSYTLMGSSVRINQLVEKAKKLNMPAVAITDKSNLFCGLEFSLEAIKNGIQPILGVIVKHQSPKDYQNINNISQDQTSEVLLIAKNEIGYQNLYEIISKIYLHNDEENLIQKNDKIDTQIQHIVDFETIIQHKEGLIILQGEKKSFLAQLIQQKKIDKAIKFTQNLQQHFKDDLYVELNRHQENIEKQIETILIHKIALPLDIPLVATNSVIFLEKDEQEACSILQSISGQEKNDEDNMNLEQYYFKTAEEMIELFQNVPEAIHNTIKIAQKCNYCIKPIGTMLPEYNTADEPKNLYDGLDDVIKTLQPEQIIRQTVQNIKDTKNNEIHENKHRLDEINKVQQYTQKQCLSLKALKGLNERFKYDKYYQKLTEKRKKEYYQRLEYEISIIFNMGFEGYFLIVADFINYAKDNNISVGPGRGSGAGSIVAWTLKITDVDPIRFGLFFERFLNPERVSMPDFDIDFCQERREEVIIYVQNKYGKDKVAQIITFGKLQAKAVLKDVGRVLKMPYSIVDEICKLIPFDPVNPVTLEEAISLDPSLQKKREENEEIKQLLEIGLKLEGLHRHVSTHAAGIVISDRKLQEIIPLYKDQKSEMPVIQYSMKYAEILGLVKFDFLGLKTLTVISKTLQLIQQTLKRKVQFSYSDFSDKKTFDLLKTGSTVGIFQLESSGISEALKQMKPDSLEDIIALISLYRPGPIANIPDYIDRKHKKQEVQYPDDRLIDCLKETYGIIIYQEQVMEIVQILAGYTLGQADILRRAMGKKNKEEMKKQRQVFVKKAVPKGLNDKKAEEIFDTLETFAGYGFNKSHAVAYAIITYQTAFLKAHYFVELMVTYVNIDYQDTDKVCIFLQELKKQKISILYPNINQSLEKFHVIDGNVSYGLAVIRSMGQEVATNIVKVRNEKGKFDNIFDFLEKMNKNALSKKSLLGLINSGAFDTVKLYPKLDVEENREILFYNISVLLDYYTGIHHRKSERTQDLFGENGNISSKTLRPQLKQKKNIAYSDDKQKQTEEQYNMIQKEYESFGFYLDNHPCSQYTEQIKQKHIVELIKLNDTKLINKKDTIKVAGVVLNVKQRKGKKGRFAFVKLSDETAIYEFSIFDDKIILEAQNLLKAGNMIILELECSIDHKKQQKINVTNILELEKEFAIKNTQTVTKIQIVLENNTQNIDEVVKLVRQYKTLNKNDKNTIYYQQETKYKYILQPIFIIEIDKQIIQFDSNTQFLITTQQQQNQLIQQINQVKKVKQVILK